MSLRLRKRKCVRLASRASRHQALADHCARLATLHTAFLDDEATEKVVQKFAAELEELTIEYEEEE